MVMVPIRSMVMLVPALCAACMSAPAPIVLAPKPVGPPYEQKMAWILRLEDQRMLRDPDEPPPPPPPPAPTRGKKKSAVVAAPVIPPWPDLLRLLNDDEARVRRRAALAVGRVGLGEGLEPLTSRLGDGDPEVRQMAAFALGLLGDGRARDPLIAALADSALIVRGSAAEALGLIGDAAAAEPVGKLVAQIVESGALSELPGEDAETKRDTPAAVFRLG